MIAVKVISLGSNVFTMWVNFNATAPYQNNVITLLSQKVSPQVTEASLSAVGMSAQMDQADLDQFRSDVIDSAMVALDSAVKQYLADIASDAKVTIIGVGSQP